MCEANAYMYQNEKEELLLECVDKVVPGIGEVYLENIFGQRKTIPARIRELRLIDHRIILEKIKDDAEGQSVEGLSTGDDKTTDGGNGEKV